jgi:Holliday junction resolvase RusA-like endonuclease
MTDQLRSFACRLNIAPAGKGRPRAVSIAGKARLHPDRRSEALEEQIALEFGRLYNGPTFDGPTGVKIVAVLGRPQNMFRQKDPLERMPGTVKPDADNIAKLVLDALQRCRYCGKQPKRCKCGRCSPVLRDDALVVRLVVQKWRGAVSNRVLKIAERPHVEIRIAEDRG